MKRMSVILAVLLFLYPLSAQQKALLKPEEIISVPQELQHKIMSGRLVEHASRAAALAKSNVAQSAVPSTTVLLYFQDYPTGQQIQTLEDLGVKCYRETWTPPLDNHPYGFLVASLPAGRFLDALSQSFVVKMNTGETERFPRNNEAARAIKADSLWRNGYTGNGVKVAILDSGLDMVPTYPDLPSIIEARDYSNYPTIGTTVQNKITGHGTHVTGTVLGRGVLSSANTGNGGGPFQGMAPAASLVFLKIGNDVDASSTTSGDVAAMHAAVDTFQANVLSMSYGGWDTYHDGSDSEDQTVDWVYSKGVPFFIAAGNDASGLRHYSGTVGANDSTALIQVNVSGAQANGTQLRFNLVWYVAGGATPTSLTLRYYNASQNPLANVFYYSTTTSPRGTRSQFSTNNAYVPSGPSTYYLKVVNSSAASQAFHIYEDFGDGKVTFTNADRSYTIAQPASADHAVAVAAFLSRKSWTAYDGVTYQIGNLNSVSLGDIAPWSSRGPRVDGSQKPDIAAPGSVLISLRDRNVFTSQNSSWVIPAGQTPADTNYYVMQGTSMATPVTSGGAALLLNAMPTAGAQKIYNAIIGGADADGFTGSVPNSTWGYGKLDVNNAFGIITSISPVKGIPVEFSLSQNFPNPFNPSTVIRYALPVSARVTLTVFNILGQQVRAIVNGVQGAGTHEEIFSAERGLASGVYFYRLQALPVSGGAGYVATRKLLLLK